MHALRCRCFKTPTALGDEIFDMNNGPIAWNSEDLSDVIVPAQDPNLVPAQYGLTPECADCDYLSK